jgi:hypothetical protein
MSYVQYKLTYNPADLGDVFGATYNRPNPHRGQDIHPDGGGPVYAIADGVLVSDWYSSTMGHTAVLQHADGKFSGYRHMARESPYTIGSTIARGADLGDIGSSGSLARGRHLCMTVSSSMGGAIGGYGVVDPIAWINAHSHAPGSSTAVVRASAAGRYTATELDGEPGPIYWEKVQSEGTARGIYDGDVDGIPGPKTHLAHAKLQAAILNERRGAEPRTSTEEDGIPGPLFWTIAQIVGGAYGYDGIVDGIPGPKTIHALYKITAEWLNRNGR